MVEAGLANTAGENQTSSDSAFFQALYMQHYDYIKFIVYSIIKDASRCEDITQETFVQALLHLDKLRAHPKPQGWLVKTAKHQIGRYYREAKKQKDASDAAREGWPASAQSSSQGFVLLGQLDKPDAQILLMFYEEGLSVREIAQALGIKEDAAKKRLSRARTRYRKTAERRRKISFLSSCVTFCPFFGINE